MANAPIMPDRNLALELVRVTESAAMAASRWMGRGDKEGADGAAVDAMRHMLRSVSMDGVVVIGEGEKDEAPMLYNGERIGDGTDAETDIAVDPIDGTTLTALGRGNALAVIAVSPRGTMYDPGPCMYMEKIAVGPEAKGAISLDASITENLHNVAKAKGEEVQDLTVVILDRDRHADHIREVRAAGARIRLIPDGDVAGAISTAWPDAGADILIGIGGTPEGVITAAALKCMGGEQLGRLWPRNDRERQQAIDQGYDLDRILTVDDLIQSDDCFFAATGITDGDLLTGVHFDSQGATTESLVMRSKSGTVRQVTARHRLEKVSEYSDIVLKRGIKVSPSTRGRTRTDRPVPAWTDASSRIRPRTSTPNWSQTASRSTSTQFSRIFKPLGVSSTRQKSKLRIVMGWPFAGIPNHPSPVKVIDIPGHAVTPT